MKNFRSTGATITVTALVVAVSGLPVLVGELVGIAGHNAAIGEDLVVHFVGEYEVAKVSAQAWTLGALLYWDAATSLVTTAAAAGANKQIGHAAAVAANPSGLGMVRLAAA